MKIEQIEQPIEWKICPNKGHWMDMIIFGWCATCKGEIKNNIE